MPVLVFFVQYLFFNETKKKKEKKEEEIPLPDYIIFFQDFFKSFI